MTDPKNTKPPSVADWLAKMSAPEPPASNTLDEVLKALLANQQPQVPDVSRPTNDLLGSGLFGRRPGTGGAPTRTNALNQQGASPNGAFGSVAPPARNVFYSFHYRDVFRVNHVRNANKIRPNDKGRYLTPNDRSLWEKVKKTNPAALRRLIDSRLNGTSVTCVLAGLETWSREWVRYEIARSLARGNGLLTVFINGCQCPNEGFAPRGQDPLSAIALGWDHHIYEARQGQWQRYDKIAERLTAWPIWLTKPAPGHVMPLNTGASAYDWIANEGRVHLIRWANEAARAAGK